MGLTTTARPFRRPFLGWLLSAAMASQLVAGDASPALPTAELEAADQAFLQALVARDRDAIERHLASDVIFLDDEDAPKEKADSSSPTSPSSTSAELMKLILLVEKAARAWIGAAGIGGAIALPTWEALLMRVVYARSYSKQAAAAHLTDAAG